MTPEVLAALVNVGSAGLVLITVILFLNFLREERKSRAEEIAKREEGFKERNTAVVCSINELAEVVSSLVDRIKIPKSPSPRKSKLP